MQTIGARLDEHGGVGPGFDAVRLGLALLVLFVHTSLLAPDPAVEAAPVFPYAPIARWAVDFAVLPLFFALSGFLVAGSLERLPLGRFLANRALRIFPAFSVAIMLSALVLGPWLTTLTLGDYFADPRFARYFLNIIGDVHHDLPGLFASNPMPNIVNGSLWTVPQELFCYALLALVAATGLWRSRWLLLAATAGLFAVSIVVYVCGLYDAPLPYQDTLRHVLVSRGAARLVPVFMLGAVIYRFRHDLPCRRDLALTAVGLYLAMAWFGSPSWLANPIFIFATAPLLSYVVIVVGLSPKLRFDVLNGRDYSYGVYLYGYPLQQSLIHLVPGMTVVPFFLASAVLALGLASLSWRFVERPALRLRGRGSIASPGQPRTAPAAARRRDGVAAA